jgi:endonuclease/exonuclease/phosphatase family metal-dependent hydrolase
MQRIVPLENDRSWQIHVASDNAIVSRFPLRVCEQELPVPFPLPGIPNFRYGQGMCLIDVPDEQSDRDFYVIAMHNKSRGGEENIRRRQRQSDAIVRWIRKLKQSDNSSVPHGTPLLIAGDMNVYAAEPTDPAHHLITLLTGNIIDEETYGPDCQLDWDDTRLVEVKPRHNSRRKEFYTWREDKSSFAPGALDRMIYTDSVVSVNHSFVLNTTTMTDVELNESGLVKEDVLWEGQPGNFDHLPLVADFVFKSRESQ